MRVAVTPEVARARFAALVKRALEQARLSGMNDGAIYKATGISPATFHRWQAGDFAELPSMERMLAFVDGLGVPRAALMLALDVSGPGAETEAPTIPPAVRAIMRILNDPKVPDREKFHITATLESLANRYRPPGRRAS